MNLTPSEEQRLLRESADRFTADLKIKPPSALGDPKDRGLWKRFADMGWLALPLPAEHGGLDGGAVEISILMEAFGRNLVSEPYLATVVLGASLIDRRRHARAKGAMAAKDRGRRNHSRLRA